jgi:hypothetical protein
VLKDLIVERLTDSADFDLKPANDSQDITQDYCVSETFTGDLETGTFSLGQQTRDAHGIHLATSGLLAITRAYSPQDRTRVLNILEHASTCSTRFSFHATILRSEGTRIPVLCTGETLVNDDGASGRIKGVFVISRVAQH